MRKLFACALVVWSLALGGCQAILRILGLGENTNPTAPITPNPEDGATGVDPSLAKLDWSDSSDPDDESVTYDLFFGPGAIPSTATSTGLVASEWPIPAGTLGAGASYTWMVVARDTNDGRTNGPTWTFRVSGEAPGAFADYLTRIPDGNLRLAMEEAIGKHFGQITPSDLESVTYLSTKGRPVSTLQGIGYCVNLQTLDIGASGVADLAPLSGSSSLRELWAPDCELTDLSPLANLADLTVIMVYRNPLDTQALDLLTPSRFPDLVGLGFDGWDEANQDYLLTPGEAIARLSGFQNLTRLALNKIAMGDDAFQTLWDGVIGARAPLFQILELGDVGITSASLGAIGGMTSLGALALWGNPGLTDASALGGLTHLQYLDLSGSRITDLGPIEDLYDGGAFRLAKAQVVVNWMDLDLVPGAANRAIVDYLVGNGVDVLFEDGNHVSLYDVVEDYLTRIPDPNLRLSMEEAVGRTFGAITWSDLHSILQLDTAERPINDLAGIEYCAGLLHLQISNSGVSSIAALTRVPTLLTLGAWNDSLTDITPLLSLPHLESVFLGGNPLDAGDLSILVPQSFPNLVRVGFGSLDEVSHAPVLDTATAIGLLEPFAAQLVAVAVTATSLGDAGFQTLYDQCIAPNAGAFESLDLGGTNISDVSLAAIGGVRSLNSLSLWGNPLITSLIDLAALTGLEWLLLDYTGVTDLAPLRTMYDAGAFRSVGAGVQVRNLDMDLRPGTANRQVVDYLLDNGVTVLFAEGNQAE